MAIIIYDDEFGARTSKIFGCSFKSINVQMGFNSQPIVFTLIVVEEKDQDFTLDKNDVRSVQSVVFGELNLLGIVQSWERTTTDPGGTGIYTVRLTDCRTVLDSANISNVYIDQPESEVKLIGGNFIYIGSTGLREAREESGTEEDRGVVFSTIIERVEAATLTYGNNTFEVDMSVLNSLTNLQGQGASLYFIEGEIRSLVSTITEFCNAVGADWWVESRRKSVVDDTVVIEIKVIRRLNDIGNPNALEMDDFAQLHGGHILRRKDGFENQDVVTNKVVWGGIKRELDSVSSVEIKPFWGFDEFDQPLMSPAYPTGDEAQLRRTDTTIAEMTSALNGDLNDSMDREQLAALKKYIDEVWGKKFYFALIKSALSPTGKDLPDFPEIIPAGWWEGVAHPQGALQFTPDVLLKMTTEDGRWGPFVKLNEIFSTGSGTIESPLLISYVTWAPVVNNSQNVIKREGESFMRCKLDQNGRHVVMTLPVALTRLDMDQKTGVVNEDRVTRHDSLENAWIPIMDRGIHYGPWSNVSLSLGRIPSPGRSEVFVDKSLVPWTFGVRGMLNVQAQSLLTDLAATKIDTLPGLAIINTGQLEVAGIPTVNIGQAIGLGGSITEIFIRFDNSGVTTRYVINLFTRELGEFKRRKQEKKEKEEIVEEKEPEDDFPEVIDAVETPPEPEPAPEVEEEVGGLDDAGKEFVFQKPEGGLGVISVKGGGPFYAVRRLSYQDLDSQSFAGGLDITGAWFLAEWQNVRNLAEPENSPGLLLVGTRVTVSIFSERDTSGPYIPFIEQTPQVFSPPPVT